MGNVATDKSKSLVTNVFSIVQLSAISQNYLSVLSSLTVAGQVYEDTERPQQLCVLLQLQPSV